MLHIARISTILTIGLLSILVVRQVTASDPSIRCGTHLIYGGGGKNSAGMYEVLKKCGEPVAKNGNTWIYEQQNMIRVLTFGFDGRLGQIESRRR